MAKGDTIKYIRITDTVADDSNKVIDLSEAGQHDVQIQQLHVNFSTTATVGNRFLELLLLDAEGVEAGHIHPGSYQAASLVYHYYFLPGIFRETVSEIAETGVYVTIQVPIPQELIVPFGWSLVIKDVEAVDAAADDMIVRGAAKVLQ